MYFFIFFSTFTFQSNSCSCILEGQSTCYLLENFQDIFSFKGTVIFSNSSADTVVVKIEEIIYGFYPDSTITYIGCDGGSCCETNLPLEINKQYVLTTQYENYSHIFYCKSYRQRFINDTTVYGYITHGKMQDNKMDTMSYSDLKNYLIQCSSTNYISNTIQEDITYYIDNNILIINPKSNSPYSFNIYTLNGSMVKQGSNNTTNLSNLNNGVYILKIQSGNKVMNKKIILLN